jgi:phosphoglycolate phosphatase
LYKLAIFDFDGTLVDSAPGIVDVMAIVVEEYKLPREVFEQWRQLIGVPLMRQMEIIFPSMDEAYHVEVCNRYRAIYDGCVIEICPPFPHLTEMLRQLKAHNVDMAIASSKRRNLITPVLEHHGLSDYFKMVVGQQDVANHKPHPESVHYITKQLQVPDADVVVIGDSTYDLEMAKLAGVDGIGVTTGIHTKEILATADPKYIVEGLHQVLPLILNGRLKKPA